MTFLMLLLAVVAGLLGYRVARDSVAATIYHGRLVALQGEFSELTDRYNAAVTRSAVTELLVKQGAVRVLVRSDDGVLQTIETPYDPASEIFIDYAVLDGKLWIRRVFDENTPPNQGVLIDGGLSTIDWDSERARHGKIAYRSLTDGRWVVSVSGDGSVALRKNLRRHGRATRRPAGRDGVRPGGGSDLASRAHRDRRRVRALLGRRITPGSSVPTGKIESHTSWRITP